MPDRYRRSHIYVGIAILALVGLIILAILRYYGVRA